VGDISQFLPGLGAALLIGIVIGPVVGHLLGIGRLPGIAGLFSLGLILLTTLAQGGDVPGVGTQAGTCDLTRFGPGSITDLTTINEVSLNVLLFAPLGLTLGVVRRSRWKALAIAAAVALPFVIEWVQLLVPSLGRYCDTADIADNLTGLVIGLVIGEVIGTATRKLMRPS
jgi:hypothetical protein